MSESLDERLDRIRKTLAVIRDESRKDLLRLRRREREVAGLEQELHEIDPRRFPLDAS